MSRLKASSSGRILLRQRRQEQGWTLDDPRWLVETSRLLRPDQDWEASGPFAEGCSESTWSRFLRGERVTTPVFKAFCQVLGVEWDRVVEREGTEVDGRQARSAHSLEIQEDGARLEDWGDAPLVPFFCDRAQELETLGPWLGRPPQGLDCRCVAITGLGGMGKTALGVRLVEQVQPEFEAMIWRSLRSETPMPVLALIQEILHRGDPGEATTLPEAIARLVRWLGQHRVLLVLDSWGAVLGGDRAGAYRQGYEGYGELLQALCTRRHRSTVLLTSREVPQELSLYAGDGPVRLWRLAGLGEAAIALFERRGVTCTIAQARKLIRIYRGNPLALQVIASVILESFGGNAADFLSRDTVVIDNLERMLAQQTRFLSGLEQDLLCCLAVEPRSLSRDRLRAQVPEVSESLFLEALLSLERRSLIEKQVETGDVLFSLQPVVMKYVKRFYHQTQA